MRRARLAAGLLGAAALAGAAWAQEQEPPPPAATTITPGATVAGVPAEAVPPEETRTAPPPAPRPIREEEEEAASDAPPAPPAPAAPLKRPRLGAAVLQATDKITAETLRFEARVNEPVRYKGLIVTVRACETTANDEAVADSIAHLDVLSQPAATSGRSPPPARIAFRGWMFAGSPALHPFEHPSYDLWVIACKAASPVVSPGKA